MNKWDARFYDMAEMVARWSKEHTKVGCVFTNDREVVSLGYNGPPPGEEPPLTDRDARRRASIHAEKNALSRMYRHARPDALFVTKHPCLPCAAAIVETYPRIEDLKRYTCPPPGGDWQRTQEHGKELLEGCGIEWVRVEPVRLVDWRRVPVSALPTDADQEAGGGEPAAEEAGSEVRRGWSPCCGGCGC